MIKRTIQGKYQVIMQTFKHFVQTKILVKNDGIRNVFPKKMIFLGNWENV